MNKSSIGLLTFLVASCLQAATPSADALAFAPLRFEPAGSGYITRGLRFSSQLQGDRMELRSRDQQMQVRFAHASPNVQLRPGEVLKSQSNVIRGNDRSKWRTVSNYGNLHASDLYPGIDLVYYGSHGDLEYDLIVKPGADARDIRLQISGVTPTLDAEGNLSAAFIQKRPVAYQLAADGSRQSVPSRYRKNSDGTFGFALGRYDHSKNLVIDPTFTFGWYIAGSSQDTAKAIGHDARGMIYVAGITLSQDFEQDPNNGGLVPGGPQGAQNRGGYDVFIAQIDPTITDGRNPVAFATYLGGTGDDILNDMYVAPNGLVYVTGYTTSTDFPAGTVAGFQSTMTGKSDAFVVIYDITQPVGGQIVYSSYLGGGTGVAGNGVTADSKGRVYVVGTTNSSESPARNGLPVGLSGGSDAFVSGFDPTRSGDSSLFFSTFLGGSSFEQGYGITAAPDGTIWVVGQTFSNDFPVTGNGYQQANASNGDMFVSQFDPIQGSMLYSTYFGGSGIDVGQKIRVDGKGRVILTGYTTSGDFPTLDGAVQRSYGGAGDSFITILNPGATGATPQLAYSSYYGGSGADMATGLTVDAQGVIYVTGYTGSPNLKLSSKALGMARTGGQDGFVLKLDPNASGSDGISYASYIASNGAQISYGVDVDAKGIIYVAGYTTAGLFDALNGAPKTTGTGNTDGFLLGFNPQ